MMASWGGEVWPSAWRSTDERERGVVRMPRDGSCQETAKLADAPTALAIGASEAFVGVGKMVLHSPK